MKAEFRFEEGLDGYYGYRGVFPAFKYFFCGPCDSWVAKTTLGLL